MSVVRSTSRTAVATVITATGTSKACVHAGIVHVYCRKSLRFPETEDAIVSSGLIVSSNGEENALFGTECLRACVDFRIFQRAAGVSHPHERSDTTGRCG